MTFCLCLNGAIVVHSPLTAQLRCNKLKSNSNALVRTHTLSLTLSFSTPTMAQPWKEGFCDCLSDPGTCLLSFCLPCVQYGYNAEAIGDGDCFMRGATLCLCSCIGCIIAGGTRTNIRNKYGLAEDPCNDCCTAWFCLPCALSQEAREIRIRGGAPGQSRMD